MKSGGRPRTGQPTTKTRHSRSKTPSNFKLRITEEFHKDPAVVALIEEIKDAREQCDRAKAVARLGTDPARRTAEKQYKKLTEQYEELWNVKFGEIKQRLKVATGTSQSPETINELAMRVEELAQKKDDTAALFELLKIEKKEVNSDTFQYYLVELRAPEPAEQTGSGHSEPRAVGFRVRAGQFPGGPGPPSLRTENRFQQ